MNKQGTNALVKYMKNHSPQSSKIFILDAATIAPCVIVYSPAGNEKMMSFATMLNVGNVKAEELDCAIKKINSKNHCGCISVSRNNSSLIFIYTRFMSRFFGYRHREENLRNFIERNVAAVTDYAKELSAYLKE